MMRRIVSLILFMFLFALGLHAQTANIVFSLQNYNSQPVNVTRVSLSPLPPPAGASYGTNILNPTPYTVYSRATNPNLTNGVCTFTNVVLPYGYQLDVYDFYTNNSYQFFFPTNIASSTTNGIGFMGFFSGIYFVQLVNTNLTFSTNYVATTSYQTNYFTLTNGLTAIVITNAVPTNTASLVANQIFYYQTNYDAGGSAAAVQANLTATNTALMADMSASNQQAIATSTLAATNFTITTSNTLSGAIIASNAATAAAVGMVATNITVATSNVLSGALIATNSQNLTATSNLVNTASNSILSSVSASNLQAIATASLVATNFSVTTSNSLLASVSVSNQAAQAAAALVATNFTVTTSNVLSGALIATNTQNLTATSNLVNTASNSILSSVSASNSAAIAIASLVATNISVTTSNSLIASVASSNAAAIATASLVATNFALTTSNSLSGAIISSNAAATAAAALVATNYANSVSNVLSGAIIASNSVALAREQAISNYAAYVLSQVGRTTNSILVIGGTGTFANANGTDDWSTASGVWTNLNGISTITPAGIITISAINVAGSVIGYPVGGAFTNITGSGTLPTTQFFTNGLSAGSNITITDDRGVKTINSTGGGGGTGTPLASGTNTVVDTLSGSNRVNVPFGIFDLFGAALTVQTNLNSVSNSVVNTSNVLATATTTAQTSANTASNSMVIASNALATATAAVQTSVNSNSNSVVNISNVLATATTAVQSFATGSSNNTASNFVRLVDNRNQTNTGVMYFTNISNTFNGQRFIGSGSGAFSGDGGDLIDLNAAQLAFGLVPDLRISSTWAKQTDLSASNAVVITQLHIDISATNSNTLAALVATNTAIALSLTNALGGLQASLYTASNNIIVASGFGSAIINQTYFLIGTNFWVAPASTFVPTLYYVKDGSGNYDFINTTGGLYYTSASGPTNSSYSVGPLGAGPGGFTFYTNAPLGAATIAAITNAVNAANGIANVVTNDATASAFIAAANIRDTAAQSRIYNFVNFLKQKNRWNSLNDARFFDASYQPTNNLSLYRISWGALNPSYSGGGFITTGSNATWGPLRSTITNQMHTEVYVRRVTAYYMNLICRDVSDLGKYYAGFSFLGGVQNSNTSAGVFLSRAATSTVGTWEHTGSATNWNFDNAQSGSNQTTNFWADFDSNSWLAGRVKSGYVIIVASTSNNVHELWINGVHAAAGNTPTGTWQSLINCTNALDTFQLGTNADYTSLKIAGVNNFSAGEVGGYNGNSSGEEILAVGCWNTNANQSFVNDITTAYLMLQPQTRVIQTIGASMLNPSDTGGDGTLFPWTNSLLYIDSQINTNANDLRIETAAPGGSFLKMLSPGTIATNILGTTNYPDYLGRDILAAGKEWEIWTVGADNDATASGPAIATTYWNSLMQEFQNAGVSRTHMLCRPMVTDNGSWNTNLWNYYLAMRTNNLVTGRFIFQIGVISTNFVAANSYSTAHFDKQFGYNMLVQEVRAFRDAGFNFYNPTNPVEPWIYGVTAANDGSGNLSTFFNGNLLPSKDGVVSLGGLDGNTANRLYDVTASHTVSGQFIHASGAYVFGVDVGLTTGIYSTNSLGHGVKMNFEGGILTSTNSL